MPMVLEEWRVGEVEGWSVVDLLFKLQTKAEEKRKEWENGEEGSRKEEGETSNITYIAFLGYSDIICSNLRKMLATSALSLQNNQVTT
jgi:hypothetical protein